MQAVFHRAITLIFTIIADHNPLIPILNNHCLDEYPCLQRLKVHLMVTTGNIVYHDKLT